MTLGPDPKRLQLGTVERNSSAETMGSSDSNEAEVSAMPKKLNDDLDRIEKDKEADERQQRAKEAERQRALDAETIPLKIINGPDGELDANARLSGTLQEFIEKEVAPELGVSKECAKHLKAHLSGYQLKPNTKIIRDFTELCSVRTAVQLQGLTDGAWLVAGV